MTIWQPSTTGNPHVVEATFDDESTDTRHEAFARAAIAPHLTHMAIAKDVARLADYMTQPVEPDAGWLPGSGARFGIGEVLRGWELGANDELNERRVWDCDGLKLTRHLTSTNPPEPWPLPNVCLGTSIEDQATAEERIPHLLNCPAAVRFLSAEPLLGAIDLTPWLWRRCDAGCSTAGYDAMPGFPGGHRCDTCHSQGDEPRPGYVRAGLLHQVIVGGESGPNARPMHPDWARSIRDQCEAAGVPFFFKQWGEWVGGMDFANDEGVFAELHNETVVPRDKYDDARWHNWNEGDSSVNDWISVRVGKKAAGRLLDGVEHNGMPVTHDRTHHTNHHASNLERPTPCNDDCLNRSPA